MGTQTINNGDVGAMPAEILAPQKTPMQLQFEKELADINAQAEPLRQQRDELANQIRPIEDQIRELNQRIKEIEMPRKGQIEQILRAIS